MTEENFQQVTESLLSERPFRIFTIQLHNGKKFEIDHPRAMAYKDGLVVFIAPGKIPVWFDHESVSEVIQARAIEDA